MSLQLQTPVTCQVPNYLAAALTGIKESSTHLGKSLCSVYPLHSLFPDSEKAREKEAPELCASSFTSFFEYALDFYEMTSCLFWITLELSLMRYSE